MMLEAMRRSIAGLGFAAIFTFVFLTIFTIQNVEVPVATIWSHMLGSMLMGIYFGSASLIFDIEKWSPLKQLLIHFILSLTLWLPLAMIIGWLPVQTLPIIIGIVSFIVIYLLFWFGIRLYLTKLENDMNRFIRK